MIDTYGRKINYMRISVTDLCNLRCRYCMPEEGIIKKQYDEILRYEEILELVKAGAKLGITKIRITGGEPLLRPDLVNFISEINKVEKIKDLSLTTNGILLDKYAFKLKNAGLKRVNISLDTLNPIKYQYISRSGNLNKVLDGIKVATKVGFSPIKINVVLIKGFNDDEIDKFVQYTINYNIDIRFIELMPLGTGGDWAKKNYLSNEEVINRFPELQLLTNKNDNNIAQYYKLPNAKGRIGLISPMSHMFCNNCNRIRITADGKIKPCLHSNQEINIRKLLENGFSYYDIINEAILNKPLEHKINVDDNQFVKRQMYEIGG